MKLIPALCWILDLLALLALGLTYEVSPALLAGAAAVLAVSVFVRVRISDRWAMVAFVAVMLGAVAVFFTHRWPPLILAAHAAPFVQAVVWFCADTPRWRNWRLTLAFMVVILASALSPDFFLSMITLTFLSLALFRITLSYVDSWCSRNGAERPVRLPRMLIAACTAALVLTLLFAGMIFPILPRVSSQLRQPSNEATVGYTEEVNVATWFNLSGEGGGAPLLRVYLSDHSSSSSGSSGREIGDLIPDGLIRGRVLDHFDGESWKAISPHNAPENLPSPKGIEGQKSFFGQQPETAKLELIREPMSTVDLPLPYGVSSVSLLDQVLPVTPVLKPDREWEYELGYDKRVAYTVTLPLSRNETMRDDLPRDAPLPADLVIPRHYENERMSRLSREIFGRARTVEDKVRRLRKFLSAFRGGVGGESPESAKEGQKLGFTPLERFIFIEKQGHCELFSTAAALLLRGAGVPARMVAGFRVTHPSSGGVLTIRRGDAHAWVEYWNPEMGWRVLDLTPRILAIPSLFSFVQDTYDRLSGLWFRYVLSYESISDVASSLVASGYASSKQREISRWSGWVKDSIFNNSDVVIVAAVALSFLALIAFVVIRSWFPWILSIRRRVRRGPWRLNRERSRMESWIGRQLDPWKWLWNVRTWATMADLRGDVRERWGTEASVSFDGWASAYGRLRFGSTGLEALASVELRELRVRRARFRATVRGVKRRG